MEWEPGAPSPGEDAGWFDHRAFLKQLFEGGENIDKQRALILVNLLITALYFYQKEIENWGFC